MNRTSTPSWGLLGSAKHRAKMWKLGIDKVHRDVGNSACGPALQRGERKVLSETGFKEGHMAEPHSSQGSPHKLLPTSKTPAAWPTHHTEQSPFVEGRMESDELGLGSWLSLNNTTRRRRKGKQATRGRSRMWVSEERLLRIPDLMACLALTKEVAQTQGCFECEKGG